MVRDLTEQAQTLLQSAHEQELPMAVMEQVVMVLQEVAGSLNYQEYFLLRYPDESWLTLRSQEGQRWLLAYGHESDAQTTQQELSLQNLPLQVVPLEVLSILFLGLGLQQAEGLLFYDQAGERQVGKSVMQADLQAQVNRYLQGIPLPPEDMSLA
ncbi:MAG: hypothetical protein NW237_01130 [Cyanobacteriota bacterium]|nr:hypothetical protein [Cyanobacteriota bacterium]